ncbi:MAG: DUF2752 domain-containing protein [Acidimicrobiia bacterium]
MTPVWRDRMIVAGPVIGIALMAMMAPFDHGPTTCPFALLTGVACPGCGMTRAVSHLLHGDIATAITLHPLSPMILVMGLGAWVWYLLRRSGRVPPMGRRAVNLLLLSSAFLLLATWVVRVAMGTLPPV